MNIYTLNIFMTQGFQRWGLSANYRATCGVAELNVDEGSMSKEITPK